ncbi:MAG TPA: polyphosphate polymerase domain-containing protein [Erysipelothrix sp.]|nr:polyphosphate polymerase domain-containing protein [Erysipelothrix sp.]
MIQTTMIPITMIRTMTKSNARSQHAYSFRHEYKHRINPLDDYELSNRLQKLFRRDAHAGSRGYYRVSSLYFDTPNDLALREKMDGVKTREKFRIRYYNDNINFFKLEKKMKQNQLTRKLSTTLTTKEVEAILQQNIRFLRDSNDPLKVEFYAKLINQQLRPKTIVVYDREAFIYEPGNCRITLDRNLKTAIGVSNFLNPQKLYYDISEDFSILEIKYDQFLPDLVKMATQLQNRQAAAFSKYAVSRYHD